MIWKKQYYYVLKYFILTQKWLEINARKESWAGESGLSECIFQDRTLDLECNKTFAKSW